jgi:LPS export ABC transporter protein LptC
MKARFIFLVLSGTVIALVSGWLLDESRITTTQNPLEVPDNIDYYLTNVNFLAFNDQGDTRFRLQAPHLEHHIREDTSELTQPSLDYHADSGQWKLSADRGSFQHGSEIFQLRDQARIRRLNINPFTLDSTLFIFESQTERLTVPQALQIESPSLRLKAQSAVLNMKTSRHQFNGVMATYENRNKHDPG